MSAKWLKDVYSLPRLNGEMFHLNPHSYGNVCLSVETRCWIFRSAESNLSV